MIIMGVALVLSVVIKLALWLYLQTTRTLKLANLQDLVNNGGTYIYYSIKI